MVCRFTRAALALSLAAAVVVLAGCGAETVTREVEVRATTQWTDTGFDLQGGEKVSIEATGEVFANATVSGGPDGIPGHPGWARYNLVGDAPHAALIGRIGDEGEPFYVGHSFTTTVQQPGELFLGVNDTGYDNNKGAFTATVTVQP